MKLLICLLMICYECVWCLWPPEYVINLEVTETFIISDMFDSDDANDFSDYDMEMIKKPSLEILKPEDDKKYFMLHNIAERVQRDAENAIKTTHSDIIFSWAPEYHYDAEDEPVYADFMDENNEVIENTNYYANKTIKLIMEKKLQEKRMESHKRQNDNPDYNYDEFKRDYDQEVAKEMKSKDVLKYVDVTEKEGLKDSAKNMLTLKKPQNCTKEEMKGIGINAARCFFKDFGKFKKITKKQRKNLFKRLLKMIIIWVGVYLIIAIPCWCTKGWCCCCCRCKFCRPRETIEATKQFLANNPVGVLHVDGKKVTYKPTVYEVYAQKRLEKVVLKL